ncbi:hypothetical protein [Modestobacter excelsi]|nr:hypothetical protein [Modestobacter excelsi]
MFGAADEAGDVVAGAEQLTQDQTTRPAVTAGDDDSELACAP